MEDFILDLLGAILEPLLEALCEYVLGIIVGFFWPGDTADKPIEFGKVVRAFAGYLFVGAIAGALTLAFFPHRFFHYSRVPGLSLTVSPVITGLLLAWTGTMRRKHEKEPAEIESFGYGFFFALGVALIRFLWVR